jgi:hypothetical protein
VGYEIRKRMAKNEVRTGQEEERGLGREERSGERCGKDIEDRCVVNEKSLAERKNT